MGFPVTQCPMGLSDDGLPTGVQIVSNLNNDHLTIKLAEYFESNLVGWIPPFTKWAKPDFSLTNSHSKIAKFPTNIWILNEWF